MDKQLQQLAQKHRVNAYLVDVQKVVSDINAELPNGYRAAFGWSIHDHSSANIKRQAPSGAAIGEWAYIGKCRVVHGDPAYPIYIYKSK